jgi:glucose-1-phosphate thymidylyltransferase
MSWGLVPAAGAGSRIQPLAFSKELLPVGTRRDGDTLRPRAVSEYLVDRLVRGGASQLCFVVSAGKYDILEYYGGRVHDIPVCYAVQAQPRGLCDAVFTAAPLVHRDDPVLLGLPDTIWFPEDGLCRLPTHCLSFLLFPVRRPHLFDAVVTDAAGRVREVQVKRADASSPWIWGAIRMPGAVFHDLHALWLARRRADEYLGTLVNAYLAAGGTAHGTRAGTHYVDVGTVHGYHEALRLLDVHEPQPALQP